MESLSLVELKQLAKDHVPPIKMYYIMPKAQLIQLLSADTFPEELRIQKLTLNQLRQDARHRRIANVWKLKRHELVERLYPRSTDQNNENNHNT